MADYSSPRCGNPTSGSYIPGGLKSAFCESCQKYLNQLRYQVEYEASFDYP